MSGSYSERFSLRLLLLVLCAAIGFSFAVCFSETENVYADGGMWAGAYNEGDLDEAIVQFGFYEFNEGDKINFILEPNKNEFDLGGFIDGPTSISNLRTEIASEDERVIKGTIVYKNDGTYRIRISGTNVSSVKINSYSFTYTSNFVPTSTPTSTPTPTPTK